MKGIPSEWNFRHSNQNIYIVHLYYICTTMTMDVLQVRVPKELVKVVEELVEKGEYMNKSDVVRDAIRILKLRSMVGIIPNKGDSVKQVRAIRKKLSKQIKSWEDLKKMQDES